MNVDELTQEVAELRNDLRNERLRNADQHALLVQTGDHLEEAMNQAHRDFLYFHGNECADRFRDLCEVLESIAGRLPYEID